MSDFLPSTMQDYPLTLRMVLDHGRRVHARTEVATFEGTAVRRARFSEVADRADRLACALRRSGSAPATASPLSAGTHKSTWRCTWRCRLWAPWFTPSTWQRERQAMGRGR
jgi:hypothetical protein